MTICNSKDYGIRRIDIKNKELLSILDGYLKIRTDDQKRFEEEFHCSAKDSKSEDWCSDEYLQEIINQGRRHVGFPDKMKGYEIRINQKQHQIFSEKSYKNTESFLQRTSRLKQLGDLNTQIMNFLCCRNNALHAVYPPGGFISWHNNANAAAWNFVFTYSETGDGYFKYWDIDKKEVVYMYDKPGWTLKAGYFGHYGEPDKLFYHAASTKCWRHTVSFTFDISEISEEWREEIIDEISSE